MTVARMLLPALVVPLVAAAHAPAQAPPHTSSSTLDAANPMTTNSAAAQTYSLRALAPVLIVDAVERSIRFWTEQLGFTKENVVPGPDGTLVFASVKKDGIEIMYQSRASVIAESPASAADLNGRSAVLFITVPSVADLDVLERRTKGAPIEKPRHDTFYGTTEFYIREPGGHVVGFAAPKP